MNFLNLLKLVRMLLSLWSLYGNRIIPILDLIIMAEKKGGKGKEKLEWVAEKYIKTIDQRATIEGIDVTVSSIVQQIKSLLR